MEAFLELSNHVSWHDAALSACFLLGLDDETIRYDRPVGEFFLFFSLSELINLVLFLNGSDLEVEVVKEPPKPRHPAPAGTHCVSPAHPMPRSPTYNSNGSYHQPNPKFPALLRSSTVVLSPGAPAAWKSRRLASQQSSLLGA